MRQLIEPKTIVFTSGKGGSGKTTIIILMAHLLAEMGLRCLLIDFDLATNGSSYFFEDCLTRAVQGNPKAKGIWELLTENETCDQVSAQILDISPLTIKKNFYFVASRINLQQQGEPYDILAESYTMESVSIIIEKLKIWAAKNEIHYVLIDCPAGYSVVNIPAIQAGNLMVSVIEYDPISQAALSNFLVQLDDRIKQSGIKTVSLINKLDINETRIYDQADKNWEKIQFNTRAETIKNLAGLSPLPYDKEVREAFGKRQFPPKKESPLTFAIFPTIKDLLRKINDYETIEIIEKYENEKIKPLYEEYTKYINNLDKKIQEITKEAAIEIPRSLGQKLFKKDAKKARNIVNELKEIYKEYDQFASFLLAYEYSIEEKLR